MTIIKASEQIFQQANSNVNKQVYGSILYNVKAYGAKGDGLADDTTKIASAITTASIAGGVVALPPGTYITGNLTVPSNVTLWFTNGAKLSINNGATVTINGPIEAGLYQIFSGLGKVTGSIKVSRAYPQWWGAKGDGVNDDTTSIQKAIDAFSVNGGVVVFLSSGSYLITAALTVTDKPVVFAGSGVDQTRIIQLTPNANIITFTCTVANQQVNNDISQLITLSVRDMSLVKRDTNGGTAISGTWTSGTNNRMYCNLENLVIIGIGNFTWSTGVYLYNVNGLRVDNVTIKGNPFEVSGATSDPFTMKTALYLDGDNTNGKIDHLLSRISGGACTTFLKTTGWYEGLYMDKFEFVGCTYGVDFTGYATIQNPNYFLANGHIDARLSAVKATNIKNLNLTQLDCYKAGGISGVGFSAQVVNVTSCPDFKYVNGKIENVHSSSTDGLSVSGTSDDGMLDNIKFKNINATAIALVATNRYQVSGCNIDGSATGVYLTGAYNVISTDNVFTNCTTNINDASTSNKIGYTFTFKPVTNSAVTVPNNTIFVDSSDGVLKYKNGSGALKVITLT